MTNIDIRGFIQMMRSLFGSEAVHLRELVQNALEAINQAKQRGFDAGSIRIQSLLGERKLQVIDDGIGMTRDDILNKLIVLFRSGWPQTAGTTLGIGQFGFGFYSVFLVADEVEVITRHRESPAQACRMKLRSDSIEPEIESLDEPLPPFGTTLSLTLRADQSHLVDSELICEGLKQTYLYTEYPVTVNDRPLGLPTSAGWCRQFEERGSRSHIGDWFKERYSWSAPPLFVEKIEIDNGGWLAVVPEAEDAPPLEVYRRGIVVTKQELIPTPHNLIMTGVVDMRGIGIKPDRETLIEDDNHRRLIDALSETALKVLTAASSSHSKTTALFEAHRRALTLSMLSNSSIRERLGLVYPVPLYSPSSTASETRTNLSELTERNNRVIWVANPALERGCVERAWKLGQKPIVLEDEPERVLFEQICQANDIRMLSAAEAYAEEMRDAAVPDRRLEMLFRAAAGADCEIICCEDNDTTIPVRVVKIKAPTPKLPNIDSDDTRSHLVLMMFNQMLSQSQPPVIMVIVNRRSPIIELLASRRGSKNGPRTARLLVFVAKVSTGIELSPGEQEMFNNDIVDQLTESEGLDDNEDIDRDPGPSRDSFWRRFRKGRK